MRTAVRRAFWFSLSRATIYHARQIEVGLRILHRLRLSAYLLLVPRAKQPPAEFCRIDLGGKERDLRRLLFGPNECSKRFAVRGIQHWSECLQHGRTQNRPIPRR